MPFPLTTFIPSLTHLPPSCREYTGRITGITEITRSLPGRDRVTVKRQDQIPQLGMPGGEAIES
ncbi:hypothetical protein ASZ90_015000 [hydrocarbon metagenome]|uniref:Uncharacterized protein n=1 Tax=hydrocarbon metagenome TaxID=938273 RepID=A0A0W8F3N1_9ZZZZ